MMISDEGHKLLNKILVENNKIAGITLLFKQFYFGKDTPLIDIALRYDVEKIYWPER